MIMEEKRARMVQTKCFTVAGDWHPSMYRSGSSMSAMSLDWGDQGPGGTGGGNAEQAGAFMGSGSGLAANVMQERQASYMYIMPQEHMASKDSPEVSAPALLALCI